MVSFPAIFNRRATVPEPTVDLHDLDDSPDDLTRWHTPTAAPQPNPAVDPTRRALFARMAFVSVSDDASLSALLPEDVIRSTLVKRVILPHNPRIAGDELYELDGMDMIVVVSAQERHISRDFVRWLRLLKQLGVPMLVLLPFSPQKHSERETIQRFSQHVGLPVITMTPDNPEPSRQQFVMTTMQIAPATGLALAAKMPDLRSPLMQTLLETATTKSLHADSQEAIADVRQQLVHQICAAYDHNGHQYETSKPALDALAKTATHYTHNFIQWLPLRDDLRRVRLTHALSTLLTGYATAVYLGATPPSLRRDLLPHLWRLYRASAQAVPA